MDLQESTRHRMPLKELQARGIALDHQAGAGLCPGMVLLQRASAVIRRTPAAGAVSHDRGKDCVPDEVLHPLFLH
nr:hypothetical protein GCM10025730_21750 [Promicromonospora thailandica]